MEVDRSGKILRQFGDPRYRRYIAVSPDGQWVAYDSSESGGSDVYIRPWSGAGSPARVSTGSGAGPRWRKDGRELYYMTPSGSFVAVDISTAGGSIRVGAPRPLFDALIEYSPIDFGGFSPMPDGQRFLLAEQMRRTGTARIDLVANWSSRAE